MNDSIGLYLNDIGKVPLLTAEDEEFTPTMKLKRGLVEKKYGGLIDEMYRAQA